MRRATSTFCASSSGSAHRVVGSMLTEISVGAGFWKTTARYSATTGNERIIFHRARKEIHAAHNHHVVGPAQDSAGESEMILDKHLLHEVAGAVTQQRRAGPSQIGQHQFANLSRLHLLRGCRIDDLRQESDSITASLPGVAIRATPETNLGHAVMIEVSHPARAAIRARAGNAAAGFTGDNDVRTTPLEIDPCASATRPSRNA